VGRFFHGRPYSKNLYSYYDLDLAGIYAIRKDRIRAYENLRKYNQKQKINAWMAECIKIDLMLKSLRDEPEFKEIVSDLEAKYQTEHERINQWLEENDML